MKSTWFAPRGILFSGVLMVCAAAPALAGTNPEAERMNKAVVGQFVAGVMGPLEAEAVARQVAPHLIEHDPLVQAGRAGTTEWIRAMRQVAPRPAITVKHMLADGDTPRCRPRRPTR